MSSLDQNTTGAFLKIFSLKKNIHEHKHTNIKNSSTENTKTFHIFV